MRAIFLITLLFVCFRSLGINYTSKGSGDWTNPATWNPTAPVGGPGAGDQVTISYGHAVTYSDSGVLSLSSLSLGGTGTLVVQGSLAISGTFSYEYNASLQVSNDFSAPGSLSTEGDVSIGGNCTLGGGLTTSYQRSFSVGGNLNVGGAITTNNGSVTIGGSCSVTNGGINNGNNCVFTVAGSIVSDEKITNTGTLKVQQDCTVNSGGIDNNWGKTFFVGGSLICDGSIENDGDFSVVEHCSITNGGISNGYHQTVEIGDDLSVEDGIDNDGSIAVGGNLDLTGDLENSYENEIIISGSFNQNGNVSSDGDIVIGGDYHYTSGNVIIDYNGDIYVLGDLDGTVAGCDPDCFPQTSCPGCELSGSDDWESDGAPGEEYVDDEPPVFSDCPSDISVYTGSDSSTGTSLCSANVSWTEPTVTDNKDSSPDVFINTDSEEVAYTPGYSFPLGVTTVSYLAVDNSGNTAECSFVITVIDTISPIIHCPNDTTVSDFSSVPTALTLTDFSSASLFDNCELDESSFLVTNSYAEVDSTIVLSRTYHISDQSGNSSSCTRQITIENLSVAIRSENLLSCTDHTVTMTSVLEGLDTPTYQWEKSTDGGNSWSAISGENSSELSVVSASAGDRYRLLVADSYQELEVRSNELIIEADLMPPLFPVDEGKYTDFRICTGTLPWIIDTLVTVADVIDNCDDFQNLLVSYTLTAPGGSETTENNVAASAVNNLSFAEGTSNLTLSFSDRNGNSSADYHFGITVGQELSPVSIHYETPDGGSGTADEPMQCQSYIYYTESVPESSCTYQWNIYTGTGTGGNLLQAGSDYLIVNRNAPAEPSQVQISWPGTLTAGSYTLEAIKVSSTGCQTEALLTVVLKNSFNLSVADPGQDCKGESLGLKQIEWEIEKHCGDDSFSFSYTIVEGDYDDRLSVPSAVWDNGESGTVEDETSTSKSISQVVNYGDGGDFYTNQVFTLFIYDITDGNGETDINTSDNHHKFYLNGIPNTSEISTN